jgi:surface antigen
VNTSRFSHLALGAVFIASSATAEPPPWAPAHGWRKKNDPDYVGYTGKKWQRDYGVIAGRCNTAAVGAVLGGIAGAAVGSGASENDRPVAIVVGATLGALIGAKVGQEIDQNDRACFGHALELAAEKKTVVWTNAATGVTYRLTPTRNIGTRQQPCREFKTVLASDKKRDVVSGVACRRGNGEWVYRT